MAKRKANKWVSVKPDPVYNSLLVSKFINRIMYDGKRTVAMKVFYDMMGVVKVKGDNKDPYQVFEKAIENVKPRLEVRTKRVGGANYQIPVEVGPDRKLALAVRWIVKACAQKKGRPMAQLLAEEILAAYNNEGNAIKTKINVQKMAEANKVFAYFKW